MAGVEAVRTLLLSLSNILIPDSLQRRTRRSCVLLPDLLPPLQKLLLLFTFSILLTRDEYLIFISLMEGPGKLIFSLAAHVVGTLPR